MVGISTHTCTIYSIACITRVTCTSKTSVSVVTCCIRITVVRVTDAFIYICVKTTSYYIFLPFILFSKMNLLFRFYSNFNHVLQHKQYFLWTPFTSSCVINIHGRLMFVSFIFLLQVNILILFKLETDTSKKNLILVK
jgi:hypothetical protein